MSCCFGAYLSYFFFNQFRWFAPGQIEINLLSGQILRHIGRTAKVERRARLLYRRKVEFCIANMHMFTFKGDGFAFKQTSPDAGELGGCFIAFRVIEEHTVARQLLGIASRDQVKQRPPVGEPVERGGLTCCHGRGDHARTQRDQEFQTLSHRDHRCSDQPGILAGASGGDQHAGKTDPVRCLGNLLQISVINRAGTLFCAKIVSITVGG